MNVINAKKRVVFLLAAGLLSACATQTTPKPQDWAKAVQTADTQEAHLKLAAHYEEVAKTLEADMAEEKAMLDQYMAQPHKYGKRIQDLKAHATRMVRELEIAAQESRQMAEYHRQMAAEAR
jgi:vancomycin resistance protein YoaR